MNKLFKIIVLWLAINSALAAKLDDVVILDLKQGNDNFEVKLRMKNGPKNSFFLVDIVKNDKDSFDKLALILKKLKQGDDFKLSLNIPSFSMSPSGSYYRSDSVIFSGTALGESLISH